MGTDGHLPAVCADLLTASSLRQRLRGAQAWTPEFPGDAAGGRSDRTAAAAAVLVPLVQREQGLHVLLTRRADHLRDHAGQISFPGGRAEPQDADAAATALREAHEEVGLPHQRVEVIGLLPVYTTVTAFEVTPVVALVTPPFELTPDPFEVAEVFEVPLAFLMTPAHHRRHCVRIGDVDRRFLSIPWMAADPSGQPREYFIWGATAAMLRNLYAFLSR